VVQEQFLIIHDGKTKLFDTDVFFFYFMRCIDNRIGCGPENKVTSFIQLETKLVGKTEKNSALCDFFDGYYEELIWFN
jgi:hypothetical protein